MTPKELAQIAGQWGEVMGYVRGLEAAAVRLEAQAKEWLPPVSPTQSIPWWRFGARRRAAGLALARAEGVRAMREAARYLRDNASAFAFAAESQRQLVESAARQLERQILPLVGSLELDWGEPATGERSDPRER
jgi:hypothetical protein